MDSDLTLDFIIIIVLIIANGFILHDGVSHCKCEKNVNLKS